jgi:hypothetical protein
VYVPGIEGGENDSRHAGIMSWKCLSATTLLLPAVHGPIYESAPPGRSDPFIGETV